MKNKNIIYLVVVLLLFSCDKRKDFFNDFNEAPLLSINSKDNLGTNHLEFTDNVVDSFKLTQSLYLLNILSSDESTGNVISAFISPANNIILNQSAPIINGDIEEIRGQVVFSPSTTGTFNINVEAVDKFMKSSTAQAQVVVFANKPPVIPTLVITPNPLLNQYQHNFDASSAFDQDQRFGGKIVKYNWQVDANYNVETEFNVIEYIFPFPGTYVVRVRCQDNDGAWSPFIAVSYLVN